MTFYQALPLKVPPPLNAATLGSKLPASETLRIYSNHIQTGQEETGMVGEGKEEERREG